MRIILPSILLVAVAAQSNSANACEPVPPGSIPKPSQAQIDAAASKTFADAGFVADVIVLKAPRFRWRGETEPPPPGQLHVVTVIKGSAPATLLVPLADPCLAYFQRVGERLVVFSPATSGQIFPLPDVAIESLKRRRIGEWKNDR